MTSGVPAEFDELTLKISEPIFKRLFVAQIAARFDIVQDSRPMKQQTVALALGFSFFWR